MKTRYVKKGIVTFFTVFAIFILINCSSDNEEGNPDPTPGMDPVIVVTGGINAFGDVDLLSNSISQNIQVMGTNLIGDISINSNNNFELSLDDDIFSSQITISKDNGNSGNTTVYVRFSPTEESSVTGSLSFESEGATTVTRTLSGTGVLVVHNYVAFNAEPLAFGDGFNQSSVQTFNLHNNVTNIAQIKMYLKIDCPASGCDDWDRFANVKVKDATTDTWFEIGRYITPYWTGTQQLDRGLEFDVTDFKSLLTGTVELRIYIENWTSKADIITVDFDYIEGEPDYAYYAVSEVLGYHINSIDGVPYGVDHDFDLDKQISIPANSESTHLRTVISGWGHATPNDPDGRPCAEWCYRTHVVKINGANMFQHNLGPLGCASNPISNQSPGNWQPNRAGWCPGMAVPSRIDEFTSSMAGNSFTFEYDYEDWVNNGANGSAYYATSTYVIVKSNSPISSPVVTD